MSEIYTPHQIEELFYSPNKGRKQKHPWQQLDIGMSFILRCDDYCEDYRGPDVPQALKKTGYKVTRTIHPPKFDDDSNYVVITRIE
jgi:hypothetical protein